MKSLLHSAQHKTNPQLLLDEVELDVAAVAVPEGHQVAEAEAAFEWREEQEPLRSLPQHQLLKLEVLPRDPGLVQVDKLQGAVVLKRIKEPTGTARGNRVHREVQLAKRVAHNVGDVPALLDAIVGQIEALELRQPLTQDEADRLQDGVIDAAIREPNVLQVGEHKQEAALGIFLEGLGAHVLKVYVQRERLQKLREVRAEKGPQLVLEHVAARLKADRQRARFPARGEKLAQLPHQLLRAARVFGQSDMAAAHRGPVIIFGRVGEYERKEIIDLLLSQRRAHGEGDLFF